MSSSLPLIADPLLRKNPVTVQLLGVCSALAITRTLMPALIMSLTLVTILVLSNVVVSALRHHLPRSVRLILEMMVIASGVTVADQILKAYVPDIASTLSVFIGLIITNCIVLARAESFAMHNPVWPSALDGLGHGLGYSLLLLSVAAIRELFGTGKLFDYPVLLTVEAGGWFHPLTVLALPASAFFIVGIFIWFSGLLVQTDNRKEWRFNLQANRGTK